MDIEDTFVSDILSHERNVPWPYCDDRGWCTIGGGELVKTSDDAVKLPLVHASSGVPATDDEKRAAWSAVTDAFRPGLSADAYRERTDLRVSTSYAAERIRERLDTEFLPALRKLYHGFDSWPDEARRGEVDMIYSLGVHGLDGVSHYPNHVAACQRGDFATAAEECVRSEPGATADTCRKSRNRWTVAMFRAAAQKP